MSLTCVCGAVCRGRVLTLAWGTDRTLKAHKMHIQIPWDLASMYGDCLSEETDGAEDEEVEAYEDSKKRLKASTLRRQFRRRSSSARRALTLSFFTRKSQEADDLTRNMTKEEYLHYADCAQASFVYRKSTTTSPPSLNSPRSLTPASPPAGKKFRDFLSLGNSIDGVAFNDEVMDVLGFLAYEMVRKLCEAGVETKKRLAVGRARAAVRDVREGKEREEKEQEKKLKRARRGDGAAEGVGEGKGEEDEAATMDVDKPIGSTTPASVDTPSTKKARKTPTSTTGGAPNDTSAPSPRSPPRPLLPPTSLFSEPLPVPTANTAPTSTSTPAPESLVQNLVGEVLGAQEKGAPLLLHEVSAGFVSLQQGKASLKASGMRNWRGGVSRLGNRFV